MRFGIFKDDYIKIVDKYKYDPRYIDYITLKLVSNEIYSIDDIISIYNDTYGNYISRSKAIAFLKENYFINDNILCLSISQKFLANRMKKIEQMFYYFKNTNLEYVKSLLLEKLNNNCKDLDILLPLCFLVENNSSTKPDYYYFMIACDVLKQYNNYEKDIDKVIFSELSHSNNQDLTYIVNDSSIIELLKECNVLKTSDLYHLSIESIISIFSNNVTRAIAYITISDSTTLIANVKNDIGYYFNKLFDDDRKKDIFFKRYNMISDQFTLEQIGKHFGITRERVRQICEKTMRKLENELDLKQFDFSFSFYSIIGSKNYLTLDELKNIFIDSDIVNKLCLLCFVFDGAIKFSKKYEILYDQDANTIEDLVEKEKNKIGDLVNTCELHNVNSFQSKILLNDYKNLGGFLNIKIAKELSYIQLITNVIDENFEDGYKPGNEKDYLKLKELFTKKYGHELAISMRALGSDIMRLNYCYIDKGTVKNRKYLPELSREIILEINNFLNERGGIVYYQFVFDNFKDKLKEYGINNRYYLKGMIDDKLFESFSHHRDYIVVDGNYTSPFKSVQDYIECQTGVINISSLKEKYPGAKDYMIYSYISKINDVIWIKYMEQLILRKNVMISDNSIVIIKKNINDLFESLHSDVIVCSKLYARLKIMNKSIFDELKLFNSDFAFFSLLSCILKNEFYFKRPYISRNNNIDLTGDALIKNYATTLAIISPSVINNFVKKMHLRQLFSYLDFQIEMSDNYLQIDVNRLYKKELLNVDIQKIKAIKNEIDYYLNSFGQIDTKTYNDYSSLPTLQFGWNKYLLVGIIRSYLNEDYIIEYTDTSYDLTDFIIRRG